eukprot:GHVT01078681.1.p2 GENE.GHVT01078681.1~~GHVT01078681.1.p2  ORF type:complete len:189 (-),score=23.82 GHVT01078681.1:1333-1899(-)
MEVQRCSAKSLNVPPLCIHVDTRGLDKCMLCSCVYGCSALIGSGHFESIVCPLKQDTGSSSFDVFFCRLELLERATEELHEVTGAAWAFEDPLLNIEGSVARIAPFSLSEKIQGSRAVSWPRPRPSLSPQPAAPSTVWTAPPGVLDAATRGRNKEKKNASPTGSAFAVSSSLQLAEPHTGGLQPKAQE